MPATDPTTIRNPRQSTLPPAIAERAVYIDFEGFEGSSPALVGILADDVFETVVLDPSLRTAGEAKGLRVADGRTLMAELFERARLEERVVCGFGTHELDATRVHFDVDLAEVWLNGHKVAKRWWRRARPGDRPTRRRRTRGRRGPWRRGGWTLEFFEGRLGIARPRHLRSGGATLRLRSVRDQLRRRGDYAGLTAVAKGKWTKLLAYNEQDVRSLAGIVGRAAGGGASGRTARPRLQALSPSPGRSETAIFLVSPARLPSHL